MAAFVSAALLVAGTPGVQGQDAKTAEAKVKILVPEDTTELKANDQPTKATGDERMFKSPPIKAGEKLRYTFKALIEPNNYTKITRTYVIDVEGGKEYTVDMRKADPKWADDIKVRYVPTPMDAVRAMLKMAKVAKDDVVYDLGCGDGRLVSYAVKEFGAKRGYGVDIEPERIDDSNKLAKEIGVQDKVKFEIKDVQQIKDVSDADVVLLYMGDDLDMVMRPVLMTTLKPGSRVVSHRFLMGDWMPDRSETITTSEGERVDIHLWNITEKTKELEKTLKDRANK